MRDKEGHSIMIKGSIHQVDITTVNIYTPNIGAPTHINQVLTELNAVIVGDFNTPLSTMDRDNKETVDLNTIDQMYLTDIYRTFRPIAVEYIFFSSTQNIF